MQASCSQPSKNSADFYRPLRRGYVDYPDFFIRYCKGRSTDQRTPTLGLSLGALQSEEARAILAQVPQPATCLIQGITAPDNGTALRNWLAAAGIQAASVCALDIIDVEALARSYGYSLGDVEFRVADAADLQGWPDDSVGVIAQDHLLNCAPHALHVPIVSEAARVLHRNGVWILNFSVDPRVPDAAPITIAEAEARCGHSWRPDVYSVADMYPGSDGRSLHGALVADAAEEHRYILVTRPHGNLEFYFGFDELEALLHRFGLRFACITSRRECDSQGVSCVRYRTLATHADRSGV